MTLTGGKALMTFRTRHVPVIGIFVVAFIVGAGAHLRGPSLADIDASFPREGDYQPREGEPGGEELVLIVVLHSRCSWCNDPSLPQLIEATKVRLDSSAVAHGLGFRALGLALDREPEQGWRFLEGFGRFDEIAAGGGWDNAIAIQYIFGEFPGAPATPQLIVIQRELGDPSELLEPKGEVVLRRLVGLPEIRTWVQNGAPTPIQSGKGGLVSRGF